MKAWQKMILLVGLSLAEVVFLSWILASNLPHRAADTAAYIRYQSNPSEENTRLWLAERQKTQREVNLRRSLGVSLAIGNLFFIAWAARRRIVLEAN